MINIIIISINKYGALKSVTIGRNYANFDFRSQK